MAEPAIIEREYRKLLSSRLIRFPEAGKPDAPTKGGVYIIYSPTRVVLHVGRTPSGKGGLKGRLCGHVYNASSFTKKFLKGNGKKLRRGYSFRCLAVTNVRTRALLEYLAIGKLCPKHIGLSKKLKAD